jgi:hypothetical protein
MLGALSAYSGEKIEIWPDFKSERIDIIKIKTKLRNKNVTITRKDWKNF